MEYPVNKGAGNSVEFKGLKSQYLFVFAGGLTVVLLAVVILYLAGVDQWICIPFGIVSGGLLVWVTFRLNARYGEHGLMKLLAGKRLSDEQFRKQADENLVEAVRESCFTVEERKKFFRKKWRRDHLWLILVLMLVTFFQPLSMFVPTLMMG